MLAKLCVGATSNRHHFPSPTEGRPPLVRILGHTWRATIHGDHYATGLVPGAGIDWNFM